MIMIMMRLIQMLIAMRIMIKEPLKLPRPRNLNNLLSQLDTCWICVCGRVCVLVCTCIHTCNYVRVSEFECVKNLN